MRQLIDIRNYLDPRSSSINKALELADTYRVLEIGGNREDHHSTLFWCGHARMVYSISEDAKGTESKKATCHKNKFHNLRAITADVIKWFPTCTEKYFDILYMDAWSPDDKKYQVRYAECYHALKHKLGNKSVILIDNTPKFGHSGNGLKVIEEAKEDGWVVAKQDHQVLLAKQAN